MRASKAGMKYIWLLAASLAIGLTCAGIVMRLRPGSPRQLERLVAGDQRIEITSLTFDGQFKRIVLRDPAATRYLTQAFRDAIFEGNVPSHLGTSYMAQIALKPGGALDIDMGFSVPESPNGLTLWFIGSEDSVEPVYYWVPLNDPMPESVTSALRELRGN